MNLIRVEKKTLEALEVLITGNNIKSGIQIAPYRSGPDLVDFFNQFGFNDQYSKDFPSRYDYTYSKILSLNGQSGFDKLIEMVVDPRHYLGTDFEVEEAVKYLNQFLEFDGFNLIKQTNRYHLSSLRKNIISFEHTILNNNAPNIEFIQEQISKCQTKINAGDNDGAITNARTLLESVLLEIESKIKGERQEYNGDLLQLHKRVRTLLNLEPSRKDISDSLKQVLSGMISIVNGIAPMRNKMSDSHARDYKPAEHHAKLAINSVNTICMFLLDSFEYQISSGYIKLPNNDKI